MEKAVWRLILTFIARRHNGPFLTLGMLSWSIPQTVAKFYLVNLNVDKIVSPSFNFNTLVSNILELSEL